MAYDTREEAAAPINMVDLAKLRKDTSGLVMLRSRAAQWAGVPITDVGPSLVAMYQAAQEEQRKAEEAEESVIEEEPIYRGAV